MAAAWRLISGGTAVRAEEADEHLDWHGIVLVAGRLMEAVNDFPELVAEYQRCRRRDGPTCQLHHRLAVRLLRPQLPRGRMTSLVGEEPAAVAVKERGCSWPASPST